MRESEQAGPTHEADDDFTRAPLDMPSDAVRAQPRTQRPRHRRIAMLIATGLLLLSVAVGLFVRATSDPGAAVVILLHLATPTDTATLPLGGNNIYLSNGAPWGTLTLDGQRRTPAELQGAMLHLARGRHHLDYQARYFPALHCDFSVPSSLDDTCPLDTSPSSIQFLTGQGAARIIDLGSTGATMQSDQFFTLKQMVDARFEQQAQTSVIATGDRYWDGSGRIVVATEPLRFGFSGVLSDTPSPETNTICYQFCPDPSFINGDHGSKPNPQGWAMGVTITYAWSLTDAAGRSVTAPNYFAGRRFSGSTHEDIAVALTTTGLSITVLPDLTSQAVISAAADALDQAAAGEGGGDYGASFSITSSPLDGCVMGVQYHGATANLLWRFGILLTVDAAARSVFPQLPTANAAEQALAAHILATQIAQP